MKKGKYCIQYYRERSSMGMNRPVEADVEAARDVIPKEETEISEDLIDDMPEGKIYLSILGEIDEETYNSVVPVLLNAVATGNKSDIVIFIDSVGGLLYPTMDIVRILKAMDNKIITVAFNHCSSSACLIFSAGDERCLMSGTKFIMHKVTTQVPYPDARLQDDEYIKIADELKDCAEEYKSIILEGSNITKKKLDQIFRKAEDTIIPEEEILKYKLATKIFKKFSELGIEA